MVFILEDFFHDSGRDVIRQIPYDFHVFGKISKVKLKKIVMNELDIFSHILMSELIYEILVFLDSNELFDFRRYTFC